MSDQSESAATQQVVDSFRAANAAKATLEGKMKALGESLSAFSKILQNPYSYHLHVAERSGISVGQPGNAVQGRPIAHVTPAQINWEDLCETVRSYAQAREDRKRGVSLLKDMGIPVSD